MKALTDEQSIGVAVVIPTLLRPELAAAILSVRQQDFVGTVQVVVVVDRDRASCSESELALAEGSDTRLFTGGDRYGGTARNAGVAAATEDLVAFLDDDDRWLPGKLTSQVALLIAQERSGVADVVVSGRYREEGAGDGHRRSEVIPSRLLEPGERIEDYLFRAKGPRVDRPSILTSSLLLRRNLALRVPWDPTLRRHQDWDWLARLQESGGVTLVQTEDEVLVYGVGTVGSVSASHHWGSSLAWVDSWRSHWHRRTYVDFVAAQPLRYAVQARSLVGVLTCLARIAGSGQVPGAGPVALAVAGLVPRSVFNRLRLRGRVG